MTRSENESRKLVNSFDLDIQNNLVLTFSDDVLIEIIPAGYYAARADNGNGVVYRPNGSTSNANSIRIMGPTPIYPNGYVRFYNNYGQPINFYSGKPGPQSETHFKLK